MYDAISLRFRTSRSAQFEWKHQSHPLFPTRVLEGLRQERQRIFLGPIHHAKNFYFVIGPFVCTSHCSQVISGMFSGVAHMYSACWPTRGPWSCWGYARAVISVPTRSMQTVWAVRYWGRKFSVPCFLSVSNSFGLPRSFDIDSNLISW